MKCRLCDDREANKKNTHYLTDAIIRTALNEDGSNIREKGKYFNMSNSIGSIEFNFQRNTSVEQMEEELERKLTDEEIEAAKVIPFSVDYLFCNVCENLFTGIEKDFIDNLLPKFRESNLEGILAIEISRIKTIRLFFYLQIWRTAVCKSNIELRGEVLEKLRGFILNHEQVNLEELKSFPLSITYLQTGGEQKNYTQNNVGFTNDKNPYLIIMNDFVIQFFDSREAIRFFEYHNLNQEADYKDFINIDEEIFKIKLLSDEERKSFNVSVTKESKGKILINLLVFNFVNMYIMVFGQYPTNTQVRDYLGSIIGSELNLIDKYSEIQLKNMTVQYIERLIIQKGY